MTLSGTVMVCFDTSVPYTSAKCAAISPCVSPLVDSTRALPARDHAILVLRWFLDGSRMRQLARDNEISLSTGYDYLHEGIDVLADLGAG
jgi:hypothetical protein